MLLAASCGGGDTAQVVVVIVAAQPCDRPTRSLGAGFVVADGVVATAAHTVEGPQRAVTVDGAPAEVVALDRRTDLALLAADVSGPPAEPAPVVPDAARVLTPDGPQNVEIVRTGPLVVHDTTEHARHEREVHTLTPGVEEGTSGAPLVDQDGRLLGVVVLDNAADGVAYAVTVAELAGVLDREHRVAAGCPD